MNHKIVLLSLSILFITGCSSNKQLVSKWHQNNYKKTSDISRMEYQYNSDSRLLYFVSNDSNNLYFHLIVDDRNVQKRLLINGFTIWLDSNSKAKKYMGIRYQVEPGKLLRKAKYLDYYLLPDEKGKVYDMHTYLIMNTKQELIGFNELSNDTSKFDFSLIKDSTQSLNILLAMPLEYIVKKQSKTNTLSIIIESELTEKKQKLNQFQTVEINGKRARGGIKGKGNGSKGKFSLQNTNSKPIEIIIKKLHLSNS